MFLAVARSAGDVEKSRWQLLQMDCAILSCGTWFALRAHDDEPLKVAANVKSRGCISVDVCLGWMDDANVDVARLELPLKHVVT